MIEFSFQHKISSSNIDFDVAEFRVPNTPSGDEIRLTGKPAGLGVGEVAVLTWTVTLVSSRIFDSFLKGIFKEVDEWAQQKGEEIGAQIWGTVGSRLTDVTGANGNSEKLELTEKELSEIVTKKLKLLIEHKAQEITLKPNQHS